MNSKTLMITVTPEGEITTEAVNFQGPACQTCTQGFLSFLGLQAEWEQTKPEFYQTELEQQPVKRETTQ